MLYRIEIFLVPPLGQQETHKGLESIRLAPELLLDDRMFAAERLDGVSESSEVADVDRGEQVVFDLQVEAPREQIGQLTPARLVARMLHLLLLPVRTLLVRWTQVFHEVFVQVVDLAVQHEEAEEERLHQQREQQALDPAPDGQRQQQVAYCHGTIEDDQEGACWRKVSLVHDESLVENSCHEQPERFDEQGGDPADGECEKHREFLEAVFVFEADGVMHADEGRTVCQVGVSKGHVGVGVVPHVVLVDPVELTQEEVEMSEE